MTVKCPYCGQEMISGKLENTFIEPFLGLFKPDDSNKKAGSLVGTTGAGGSEEIAGKRGGVYFNNMTYSKNTVTSNGTPIYRIYGRIGTSGGWFFVDGVQMPEVQ